MNLVQIAIPVHDAHAHKRYFLSDSWRLIIASKELLSVIYATSTECWMVIYIMGGTLLWLKLKTESL
jgi:hypothetical protein